MVLAVFPFALVSSSSYCCEKKKKHEQNKLGDKRAYFTFHLHHLGKSRQDPGHRNWSRSRGRRLLTGLLPTVCSACFLTTPWTTSSGVALLSEGWGFPCQSSFKKIHHNPALKPVLWGHLLNWGSLFQDDTNSYQVDIKLTSTSFMFFLVTSGIHSYKIFSFWVLFLHFFIF